MLSGKWWPFCLGISVLTYVEQDGINGAAGHFVLKLDMIFMEYCFQKGLVND